MLSKSQFKLITSLAQKKYRGKHQLFIVEGKKAIFEFLNSSFRLHSLYATEAVFKVNEENFFLLKNAELKKISQFSTPQTALALFYIPESTEPETNGLALALDGIRDPGNLGTIIRLCDWFGIKSLICSKDTVDCYNSKVVQASMGSLARLNIYYTELASFLQKKSSENVIFGSFMEGENLYHEKLSSEGIIVMGNEANGISAEIEALISRRISIPRFSESVETESLNVATAAAIILSEFRRN